MVEFSLVSNQRVPAQLLLSHIKMSTDYSECWDILEKQYICFVLLAHLLSECLGPPFFFWPRPSEKGPSSVMDPIESIVSRLHSTLCLGAFL